jgi:TrmH family RNA methyltransferase
MPIRKVESKQNAQLKELRQSLAAPRRAADGLVGIEGPKLLEEALRAGLRLSAVFVAQQAEQLLDGFALPPETEVLLVPQKLLDSALTTEAPQPIAALAAPPEWGWSNLLAPHRKKPMLLVLAGLQDPGNLGTILRSAEAFGASGVVCLPGTVNPWNPKAVRASAGSVFRLPIIAAAITECFARLHATKIKIFATAVREAKAAHRLDLTVPAAFLIGNEGNGLPAELARQADAALTIPCPGPVESLNAAIASSLLLYEAARQRGGER